MGHSQDRGVVIIGGSAAGVAAALELRSLSPELPITIVSGEHSAPYARPSLMYLFMGKLKLQELDLQPEERWDALNITRRWAWATDITLHEGGGGALTLQEADRVDTLPFHTLLLTTGAQARALSCEGATLEGVCGLWGLYELAELAALTPSARRATVIGGGLIGAELSEMLLSRGVATTLLVREARYAPHLLNELESELVERELSQIGVELLLGHELRSIQGRNGRAHGVVASGPDGLMERPCELVASAIGARAELTLAQSLNLKLRDGGILVGEGFKTSAQGVFAAGDCVSAISSQGELWPKGWVSAERQGRLAARGLLRRPSRETLLDRHPQLIPQISRFGRLTHTRVGAPPAQGAHHGRWRCWRHPRRPSLLTLYTNDDGLLSAVSALGLTLESAQWVRLIERALPLEAVTHEPLYQRATQRLTPVMLTT